MSRPIGLIFPLVSVLLLAAALFAAMVQHAFAADTTISAGPVYAFFEPYLLSAISAAIAGLIGWTATLVQRWTGIQIEARHREALHSAAMTGVTQALARLGTRVDSLQVDIRSDVIAAAVEWVEASVPDAIVALGATPEKVEAIATAKLGELIAAATRTDALPIPFASTPALAG